METRTKMATLRQSATEYVPKETKNISDLKEVWTEMDIQVRQYTKAETGETFKVNVIVVDGEDYRVPNIVLKNIKDLLEETPGMVKFKVKKTGEGMKTSYTVIPLE